MVKTKEIQYPTQEWLDKWVDEYMDKHPDERITDFGELNEKAKDAWWVNEIDHNRPTPFDLTPEQEKESKKARNTGTAKKRTGYKLSGTKKPKDAEKVELVQNMFEMVKTISSVDNCQIANEGREITFTVGENSYSFVLTKHTKKEK